MVENGASDVWAKLLRQLRDDKIDFVVIGGAALALHGLPRMIDELTALLDTTSCSAAK